MCYVYGCQLCHDQSGAVCGCQSRCRMLLFFHVSWCLCCILVTVTCVKPLRQFWESNGCCFCLLRRVVFAAADAGTFWHVLWPRPGPSQPWRCTRCWHSLMLYTCLDLFSVRQSVTPTLGDDVIEHVRQLGLRRHRGRRAGRSVKARTCRPAAVFRPVGNGAYSSIADIFSTPFESRTVWSFIL